MSQPDWCAVPADVLEEISKRLISWDDHVCFKSVCTSWRSASSKRPHLPLLVVKYTTFAPDDSFKLCNFPSKEFYSPLKLPGEICRGKHICGSSRGWVGLIDKVQPDMSLCNPFTGVNIRLPVLPDGTRTRKVVLSSDPVTQRHNCIIMAQCSECPMLYCRPGDISWLPVPYPNSKVWIEDTIFYQGKFYTVSKSCRLYVCQVGTDDSMFSEILPAEPPFSSCGTQSSWRLPVKPVHMIYDSEDDGYDIFDPLGTFVDAVDTRRFLVVSNGDLLLVAITETNYRVSSCEVFQVDLSGGQFRLFIMENLGGRALFLGKVPMSFSLSVYNSSPTWCRGNCIYYGENGAMVTVLNMEDSSISYMADVDEPAKYWLTPTLC